MPLAVPPSGEPFKALCRWAPGKLRFTTKKAAVEYAKVKQSEAKQWRNRSGRYMTPLRFKPLKPYKCQACSDWHLTSQKD